MKNMELSLKTGKMENQFVLCAAARDASTVNTALKKETDMTGYIRCDNTMHEVTPSVTHKVIPEICL